MRASLRAIGVLGPEVETPHGGKLDRYVESDRQIPRGFAGGPLIDADGAVIGMNTRTLLRGEDLAVPTVDAPARGRRARAHGGVRKRLPRRRRVSGGARQLARTRRAGRAASRTAARRAIAGLLVGDILVELAGDADHRPR